jgi:hypothetical protein
VKYGLVCDIAAASVVSDQACTSERQESNSQEEVPAEPGAETQPPLQMPTISTDED